MWWVELEVGEGPGPSYARIEEQQRILGEERTRPGLEAIEKY